MKPCPCGKPHSPAVVKGGRLICPDRFRVVRGPSPVREPTEAERAQREDRTPHWRGGER